MIAGLMVGASLAVAAPAMALQPNPCPDGPPSPGLQTAYIDENGVVQVNPTAAPSDAEAYAGWAVDYALYWYVCVLTKPAFDGVACQYFEALEISGGIDPANLNFRYVYPNGSGGFSVNVPLLLDDAGDSANCHVTAVRPL